MMRSTLRALLNERIGIIRRRNSSIYRSIGLLVLSPDGNSTPAHQRQAERFDHSPDHHFLVEGLCLITVILTPLQWILLPVARIMLATIFLREKEQVEFV